MPINIFGNEILIPWSNYSAGNNSASIYFQPRNMITGGIYQTFFPVPVLASTSSVFDDFSVSPVISLYYTSGVTIYNSSGALYANAYSITDPYPPGEKKLLSSYKELSITASPNPFNPVTTISYNVPHDNYVNVEVYNMLGQLVKSLVNNEFKQKGEYSITFNGENYASGVYVVRISLPEQEKLFKLIITK